MPLEPILFVPDTHHPFADMKAWKILLKVGRALKPRHLVIIGDFMDCAAVSFHSKSPDRRALLKDEIEYANKRLDELDRLGAKDKRYLGANHEFRTERYIADKAPELFGLVTIPDLLHLAERGYKYTPYRQADKLGKLFLTHDVGAAGRTATFKALDSFQHSVITGHAHRMQMIVEGNAAGEQKVSAQFGWLGSSDQVDYIHKFKILKEWALGLGIGYLHPKTGVCYVTPIPIVKVGKTYTCVMNGVLYEEK